MNGWEEYQLDEVVEKFIDYRGKTPKKVSSGIPLITAKVIKDGMILSPEEFIEPDEYSSWMTRGLPKVNDVLLTTEAPLGEVALVHDSDIALAQRIILLRGKSDTVDNGFLFYSLRTELMQHRLSARASGSTVQGIKSAELKKVLIPLPDIDTQKGIVKALSCLDRAISNLRKQNETLEQIAQTLFKHWFVDFEFPNADGKPYKSSGGEMVRSELGEIPSGWHIGKVGDFGKVMTGKTPSTKQAEYWGGDLPFVTPTDFKNYGKFVLSSERKLSSITRSEFRRLIIPENSVVVTCIGSDMGKVARTAAPCVTNQQLNSLVFTQIKNGIEYVYQFLVSQYKMLRLMALGGSTMPIINKTDFSNIEILIPEASALDQFNQAVEPTNLKIINNEQQIQTLTQIRDELLPKLMSGKLRITP